MRSESRTNRDIKASKVLLINDKNENIGVQPIMKALNMAEEVRLDLVEVGAKKNLPVCKIMDYGKWKYDQEKKKKKGVSKQQQTKEIKFRPNTGYNDLKYRAKHADKFINAGHKVKLVIRFRGREQEHMFDTGKDLLEKFLKLVKSDFNIFDPAKMENKCIALTLVPSDKK